MSYQVLARKWRPRSFPAMVGQTHVLRALIHALDHDRLHHAYLFTGTRGVGKTTVARIFAKSLNCEQGVSASPCGQCSACREIDEGRFVDLIEVDAASRTKVEDTRELLENVQYAPTRGRYKVYLIDEVHMLSGHSFNALLKTLEEPPPHVKFLLATTDPQRLPVTILSRCLQFNLKRMPPDMIAGHLSHILEQEGIAYERMALTDVARAADGSMRDALSLLDQAISYGGGRISDAEVRAMLGTLDRQYVWGLAQALAAGDGEALLHGVAALAEFAPDYEGVLAELISVLYRIALAQQLPAAIDDSEGDKAQVLGLAQRLSPEDVQLYYQIALIGRRDLSLAPDPRAGLEMVLLRMLAFRPASVVAVQPHVARAAAIIAEPPVPTVPAPRAVSASNAGSNDWAALVSALPLEGMARQLAVNCALKASDGDTFHLVLAPAHRSFQDKKREERLQQALSDYLGIAAKIVIKVEDLPSATPAVLDTQRQQARQRAAEDAIQQDSNIKAMQDVFGARVIPDTVRPVDG